MPDGIELSEREREILRLVATGASNKEIALKLVISPNTVKVHLRNIFAKIGAASRTEATLYALRTGLLPSPASAPMDSPHPQVAQAADAPPQPPPLPRRARYPLAWLVVAILGAALTLLLRAALRAPPVASLLPELTVAAPARWSQRAAPPSPVRYAAGAVYEDDIYVIGGEVVSSPSALVWRYDPATDAWQPCASKPTAVSHAQAALLGEKIYLPGGLDASGAPTQQLEVYDPRLDAWAQASPLPVALSDYALVGLEGRLYLFGGWDGAAASARVYAYDPALDEWEARSNLPAPRMHAAAVTPGAKVVLLGGFDGEQALSRVDAYYPQRDAPGQNPWEARPPLPQPRQGLRAAAITELIYVIGGSVPPGEDPLPAIFAGSVQTDPANPWLPFDAPPQPHGEGALLLPVQTHLYLLDAAHHQAYQAIYTVVFPVIQ